MAMKGLSGAFNYETSDDIDGAVRWFRGVVTAVRTDAMVRFDSDGKAEQFEAGDSRLRRATDCQVPHCVYLSVGDRVVYKYGSGDEPGVVTAAVTTVTVKFDDDGMVAHFELPDANLRTPQ